MEACGPLLVVLEETGEMREGLPVLARHRSPEAHLRILSRGLSKHLLRVYAFGQRCLSARDGRRSEPAYLFLSGNQGGFPRFGFYLGDERKGEVGYVDLHRDMVLSGRFGALDQIFPHELAHILNRQFRGEHGRGGSNQVHAIGVRTDPETALEEGFAEHFQLVAVDDPDADRLTAELSDDVAAHRSAEERTWAYAEELLGRHMPHEKRLVNGEPGSSTLQETFPRWFGRTEQVLRYSVVKKNLFARQPRQVAALLGMGAVYEAYLVENIVPGREDDPAKPPGVLASTEGVVAALFYRWARSEVILSARPGPSFYAAFGADPTEVSPLETAYLKLLYVFARHKPTDVASAMAGYKQDFPDEAGEVDRLVSEVTLGQGFPSAPALWLANDDFHVGTSVFDQYRVVPRPHTFDLNAASAVDLCSVPGVEPAMARRILDAAPYRTVRELGRVPGVTTDVLGRFEKMESQMEFTRSAGSPEQDFMANLEAVLRSYVDRVSPYRSFCEGP